MESPYLMYPRSESNRDQRNRNPLFYPLNYRGILFKGCKVSFFFRMLKFFCLLLYGQINCTMKKPCLFLCLLFTACSVSVKAPVTQIVAHRGYWNTPGGAQNSIASLKNAQEAGCWGSEFDVHLTSDDVVVVNHDGKIGDTRIQESPFELVRVHKLDNGEPVPTLDEYLDQGLQDSTCVLVMEIKPHASPEREDACIARCLESVKAHGLFDPSRLVFISFSFHVCRQLAQLAPGFTVQYLEADKNPAEVHEAGINGIDYHFMAFMLHPKWVQQAHDLGMSVNVWTVDSIPIAKKMMALGVDQLTTNEPVTMQNLKQSLQ